MKNKKTTASPQNVKQRQWNLRRQCIGFFWTLSAGEITKVFKFWVSK